MESNTIVLIVVFGALTLGFGYLIYRSLQRVGATDEPESYEAPSPIVIPCGDPNCLICAPDAPEVVESNDIAYDERPLPPGASYGPPRDYTPNDSRYFADAQVAVAKAYRERYRPAPSLPREATEAERLAE